MSSTTHNMTIAKWFFLLITGVVLYLCWQIVQPFLMVIILAGIATVILSPIDRRLRTYVKRPRASAVLLSIAVFFLVFIPLISFLFLMATQASELVKMATSDTAWIGELNALATPVLAALPEVVRQEVMAIDLGEIGKSIGSWAIDNIGNIFSSTTQLLLHTFIFFLCLYYLLINRDYLYKEAIALSPLDDRIDTTLLKRIIGTIRGVVFGVLLIAVIQAVIAGIGMTIFGVPGSLIWGGLTVIAGLVPLVGTGLVLIPAILYLFFTGATGSAIGLLIWSVVFVSTIDNVLVPYIIGGRAHLHSFLVLIAVLGGLSAFGVIGGIAGPAILAALLGLIEIYKAGILTKEHTKH